MIYPGLISEEESRILDCITAVSDLLGVGLAGVAVNAKLDPVEVVLLWAPGVEPDDDLVEDFEADYVALVGLPQAEVRSLRAQHIAFEDWQKLLQGENFTPIYWSRQDVPNDWSVLVPRPWQLTRGDVAPDVGGMTIGCRLSVHILEARNFTLRTQLVGVDQVGVSIQGDDTTIDFVGELSLETKAEIEQDFAQASLNFSALSNRGVWRLRWLSALEAPGPLSWPILSRRIRSQSN